MDTGCNTHDLLECECDSPSQAPDEFSMEIEEDSAIEEGFVAASELRQEKLDAVDKAVRCLYTSKKGFVQYKFSVPGEEKSRSSCIRGMDPYQLPETFHWYSHSGRHPSKDCFNIDERN
jgi:hypothetical protein